MLDFKDHRGKFLGAFMSALAVTGCTTTDMGSGQPLPGYEDACGQKYVAAGKVSTAEDILERSDNVNNCRKSTIVMAYEVQAVTNYLAAYLDGRDLSDSEFIHLSRFLNGLRDESTDGLFRTLYESEMEERKDMGQNVPTYDEFVSALETVRDQSVAQSQQRLDYDH